MRAALALRRFCRWIAVASPSSLHRDNTRPKTHQFLSRSAEDKPENLITLCATCHSSVHRFWRLALRLSVVV